MKQKRKSSESLHDYNKRMNKNRFPWIDILGWIGVLLLLLAYYLVTQKIVSPIGLNYNLINLSGASMLCVVFVKKKIWSNLFLEIVFISIALIAIYKNLF
jgi:hypothetical protein